MLHDLWLFDRAPQLDHKVDNEQDMTSWRGAYVGWFKWLDAQIKGSTQDLTF
jgi:hypothetical protein